jgi:2-oxoglutarate ferredoxin oxidoreductase subunit gamma
MRQEIRFAGFGGQGIISMAIILAHAAGQFEGLQVAQTQSYGPEARGGACKAEVIIDTEEIDYIKAIEPDVLLAMSQPAFDKFSSALKEGGLLIIDKTMISHVPENNNNLLSIDATEITENTLGGKLFTNVFMLGVLVNKTSIVTPESVRKTLEAIMPPKHITKNLAAFNAGLQYSM